MKIKLLLLSILLLTGCSINTADDSKKPADQNGEHQKPAEPDKTQDQPAKPEDPKQDGSQEDTEIKKFFPEPNQIRYYKGTGNEFAEEKEVLFDLQGEYLPAILSNGGTSILKIYRLTDKGIYLVYQQPEYYEEDVPDLDTIKQNFKEVPLLTGPLDEGAVMNGWKVVSVNKNLLLPIGSIRGAVVMEQENQDGSISRQYWAQDYGLVKKEFYMKDSDGNENTITTELRHIDSR